MLNRSSTLRQIQVCHPEQHTTQRHAHMNILNGWITFVVFLIPETPFKRFLVMSFILIFFVFRGNDRLLIQVKQNGEEFQRYACGPELFQIQLLPQVLQERGEGVPAGGGMFC